MHKGLPDVGREAEGQSAQGRDLWRERTVLPLMGGVTSAAKRAAWEPLPSAPQLARPMSRQGLSIVVSIPSDWIGHLVGATSD